MAEAGIRDVLLANQVVQPDKVSTLAALAGSHRLTLTVDDVRNVEQISRAATDAGSTFELLIELDVGMGRCGVRSKEAALLLAERIAELSGLRLRGLQAYEGHCVLEPDPDTRFREARAANNRPSQYSITYRTVVTSPRLSPREALARISSPAPIRASTKSRQARMR